ncbi:MAG: glycosyltransferase family 39 protein [Verrucomicrobiota bacterium]
MTDTPNSSNNPKSLFWLEVVDWFRSKDWSWNHLAWILLVALTLFRFWYATTLELVEDEAYYWLWSQNLDMCYYSKGPGIAWTIATGTILWGDNVFGIRFFSVLLSAATGYWVFRLGKLLFNERVGFITLLFAGVIPIYAVGSILMTIDPLSLFFWTLAAYTFWQAKDQDRILPWLLPGLWIGLGMLCKYTNVAQLLCFALFCLWIPRYRSHFAKPTFWSMVFVSLLSLTPTIAWNAKHDWITLQHLVDRGKLGPDDSFTFKFNELTQFISEQALVISPLFLISILISAGLLLRSSGKKDLLNTQWKFLLALFAPLILFYLVLSINEAGEANWTAPSYLAGIVMLAAFVCHKTATKPLLRRFIIGAAALALIQTIALHNTAVIPLSKLGIPDPLDRVRGNRQLAETVVTIQQEQGATFLVARRYQTASLISFYHPDRPQVFLPKSDRIENQFSFWPGYDELMKHEHSALFICRGEEGPRQSLVDEFADVRLIKEFHTTFQGRMIHLYRIYLCSYYHGQGRK